MIRSGLSDGLIRDQYREAWNSRRYYGQTRTTVTIVPPVGLCALSAFIANNLPDHNRIYAASFLLFAMIFLILLSIYLHRETNAWDIVISEFEKGTMHDRDTVSLSQMRYEAYNSIAFRLDFYAIIYMIIIFLIYIMAAVSSILA